MEKGLISKIQRYSTKDGPGLRTTVFFMGCPLKCLWCSNPENLELRPRIFYFKERCQHCSLCVQHAINHSISFDKIGCKINREQCHNLIDMVDICPYDAYEKVGQYLTSKELVHKVMRDIDFYDMGEGGVTFSGGEASMQYDFLKECCILLKDNQVHVCLDTCGFIETDKLMSLLKYVDIVLYDIKAIDHNMHKLCTGVSNELILKNALEIAKANIPMIIRLVIIPTYNDNIEDMKKRIDFIVSLKDAVLQVDILKYHIYGIGKYEKLDIAYPIHDHLIIDDDKVNELYQYAIDQGLNVTIGG